MILGQQCDASLHNWAASLQNLEDEFGLHLGIGEREWILQRQQAEEDGFCGMQLSETKDISVHPLWEISWADTRTAAKVAGSLRLTVTFSNAVVN